MAAAAQKQMKRSDRQYKVTTLHDDSETETRLDACTPVDYSNMAFVEERGSCADSHHCMGIMVQVRRRSECKDIRSSDSPLSRSD